MSVGSLLHPGSRNPLYHSRRPFEGFVLYGELFLFFPLLPSFTVLCVPPATTILKHLCLCFPLLKRPSFSKDASSFFNMIGLDLQESLPPARPVYCETDGGEVVGGGGDGGELRAPLKKRK